MNNLKKYTENEQNIIIDYGIYIHEKAKNNSYYKDNISFDNNEILSLKKEIEYIKDSENKNKERLKNDYEDSYKQYRIENTTMRNSIMELQNKMMKYKEEGIKEGRKQLEEQIELLKNQLKNEKDLEEIFKVMSNERVSIATKTLEELVVQQKKEIEKLNNKYVRSNKGIEYEKEIMKDIEKFNEDNNSVWDIQHIGQQLGYKGDIIMCNKQNKIRVMLDCKNHDKVPKEHREKFIADMDNPNNNYDIGIMISRAKIQTKLTYEENERKGKILVYISFYEVGRPEFIFMVLETLCNRINNENKIIFDKSNYKTHLENYYIDLKNQIDINTKQNNLMKNKIDILVNEYYRNFNEDLLVKLNEISVSNKKTNDVLTIDYEELEKNREVQGNKRSKHYFIYSKDGKDTIQYFKDKKSRDKKEESINGKVNTIDINTG
jgi:hypothetical protein